MDDQFWWVKMPFATDQAMALDMSFFETSAINAGMDNLNIGNKYFKRARVIRT